MITVTHVKIVNGNNDPCIYDDKLKKNFKTRDELEKWRLRLKNIAKKRYKKKGINIDVIYKTIDT